MSTTDNYSRLKKWAKDAASGKTSKIPYIDITDLISEVENLRAANAATEAAKATGTAAHPDDIAVDRFAVAMKAKMAASRAKGRSGWDDESRCAIGTLAHMLMEHVAKGDPVDIANFAMMLHQREAMAMEHHPCYGGMAAKVIKAYSVPEECPKCKGTGECDSGGTYPWGGEVSVSCDCEAARQPAPVPGLPFADLATPIKEFEARKAAALASPADALVAGDRVGALEEAAQACDQQADGTNGAYRTACLQCANAVRELRDAAIQAQKDGHGQKTDAPQANGSEDGK